MLLTCTDARYMYVHCVGIQGEVARVEESIS